MLSREQNERITRVGPGTPAGEMMRRYWQPAALVDELSDERPVKAVRLLGEDLVLFRDEDGQYGLLERRCPHRGADLSYGRLEDGGLRCTFHGWLFDARGKCLEQPPEPIGSRYFQKVQQPAYPCVERSGIIWAYMGPGRPPAFPDFDCFAAPDEYVFAFKGFVDCNWLQILEVGIDPSHASFLHRFFEDDDPTEQYGKQFRDATAGANMPITKVLREYYRPDIIADETDFGMRLTTLRQLDEENMHVRVTNMLMPHAITIPMSREMTITQWHVPVDDARSYWYAIFTSFSEPVDKEKMRAQRLELYTLPDYMPRLNKENNYGFDPEEQKTKTYTGMGEDINVHDQWAVESQGAIADRSVEHLARSDVGITTGRRLIFKAIKAVEEGNPPLGVVDSPQARALVGPPAVDTVTSVSNWESEWLKVAESRLTEAPWYGDEAAVEAKPTAQNAAQNGNQAGESSKEPEHGQ
jgi:phenylpropionate dioxygenase-like ring-hydroxylating dioxygenase large terminal subunit